MIGIFDSGVGGLTVVKQIKQFLPEYQILYFGDTARVPYGNKSPAIIKKYAEQDLKFLLREGAKLVIIACHTASAVAAQYLRDKYPQVPIFDVVRPGLDQANITTRNQRVGIIGTLGTVRSKAHEKYLHQLNPRIKIFYQACPLLVPLVEEGWYKRPETRSIVRYYLRSLKKNRIDTLVLACTHYPLLAKVIASVVGKSVKVIDPAQAVAIQVKKYLQANLAVADKISRQSKADKFYASDVSEKFKEISDKVLGKSVVVKPAVGFTDNC